MEQHLGECAPKSEALAPRHAVSSFMPVGNAWTALGDQPGALQIKDLVADGNANAPGVAR